MVFLQDEGSVFGAPVEEVWRFVGSGDHHSHAHRHRKVRRRLLPGNSGSYSWEQDFLGRPERFTMRWSSFYPVGIAYAVLAGPLSGSKFFLYYVPRGPRTGVTVVGEFVSPTIPSEEVAAAVDRFFSTEFEQDRSAIEQDARSSRTASRVRLRARTRTPSATDRRRRSGR
jgi:hypothetical protein